MMIRKALVKSFSHPGLKPTTNPPPPPGKLSSSSHLRVFFNTPKKPKKKKKNNTNNESKGLEGGFVCLNLFLYVLLTSSHQKNE